MIRIRNPVLQSGAMLVAILSLFGLSQAMAAPPSTNHPAAKITSNPAMTNVDIVKMVKAGLGEPLIMATIAQAGKQAYALTPNAMVELKSAGVSDAIIRAMLDAKAGAGHASTAVSTGSAVAVPSAQAPDDPTALHDAGIYVDLGAGSTHNLHVLDPTVFSQGQLGGLFTSALTYGIKKAKWRAIIHGHAANLRLREAQPVFYFYFEKTGSGLSNTGGFGAMLNGASSPNEFVLARMTSKGNERNLIVGEYGITGTSSGTRAKDTVDFSSERMAPGIYRVTPAAPLEVGTEYCFFYAAGTAIMGAAGGGGKLFDFGIDGP